MWKSQLTTLVVVLSICACADDDAGEGMVAVSVYGESFIEEGIPADVMDDGWAITFEKFEVSISEVEVAGVAVAVEPRVDLARASDERGHEVGSAVVPAGAHRDAAFTMSGLHVIGAASKGSQVKRFDWQFEQATAHRQCETVTTVAAGGMATLQITVHADHLFYDSLVAESPQLLFEILADADADADGAVAQAELAAAGIGAYDPGSEGGVEDLWAWLLAATRTLGHVDGEGHCEAAPVE